MRVVTDPARVDDLIRFLRNMGYAAEEVDYAEVAVGQGRVTGVFAVKLEFSLAVWRALNTDAKAEIVIDESHG